MPEVTGAQTHGSASERIWSLVRLWQRASTGTRPSRCRYLPPSSEYFATAVERHGLARGGLLGARRILRCHPLGGHGYDPVPDKSDADRATRSKTKQKGPSHA